MGSEYEEIDSTPVHLRIGVTIQREGMEDIPAKVLIDTGAEVNLIRRGIIPPHLLSPASRPLRLVAANNQRLPGGRDVATVHLQFSAVEIDSKKKIFLTAPTFFYDAVMEEDIILSYQWLADRNIDVCPSRHGLKTKMGYTSLWISGERLGTPSHSNIQLHREPLQIRGAPIRATKVKGTYMRALDMFCGRKSVAKVLGEYGYEVETLDFDHKRNPSICVDILDWDHRSQFPRNISS